MTDLAAIEPVVYTVPETAHLLRVSDQLVYELINRGALPAIELGRRRMVPRRAIDLLIEKSIVDFDPDLALAGLAAAARPTDLAEHGVGGRPGTAGQSSSVHLLHDPPAPRG